MSIGTQSFSCFPYILCIPSMKMSKHSDDFKYLKESFSLNVFNNSRKIFNGRFLQALLLRYLVINIKSFTLILGTFKPAIPGRQRRMSKLLYKNKYGS